MNDAITLAIQSDGSRHAELDEIVALSAAITNAVESMPPNDQGEPQPAHRGQPN